MSKNIVFCADGTWNGPPQTTGASATEGEDNRGETSKLTNVAKLFANLAGDVTADTQALRNERETLFGDPGGDSVQIAKYIHGVGDSADLLIKLLGGTFGTGVVARVVRGYTFVSRNYRSGDSIYLAGFSRGAYTARALAGMISSVGLLNPQAYDTSDKELAYALGLSAWIQFRRQALKQANLATRLANDLVSLAQRLKSKPLPADGLVADIPIKAVAVWDTVGAMGIPLYAGTDRLDIFRIADQSLNAQVEYGFHAMAIDELRRDFPVTKWDERENVEQIWMIGAHSDVGGGYPTEECGLSNIGLGWIMHKLDKVGVRFTEPLRIALSPLSPAQSIHEPWSKPPFLGMRSAIRPLDKADLFHHSVLQRLDQVPEWKLPAVGDLSAQEIAALRIDSAMYEDA